MWAENNKKRKIFLFLYLFFKSLFFIPSHCARLSAKNNECFYNPNLLSYKCVVALEALGVFPP